MSLALLSFPQLLHLNSGIPMSAESYIFAPENVRIFMLCSVDQRGQRKAKTQRKIIEARTPAGK